MPFVGSESSSVHCDMTHVRSARFLIRGDRGDAARLCRRDGVRSVSSQRGIALVLVLWLTVMLTVIAASFAYAMRNEAMAARNSVSMAQARSVADGAVYRTVFELMRPQGLVDTWKPDGTIHSWEDDGAVIAVNALDESGKIDINTAPDTLLKGLLQTAGGLDSDTANRFVDVIGDWKDADDLRRPNGAEAPDYQAAGLTYKPANAQFEMVAELQRVLGMTPAIYARLADSLTVYTRMPGVNPTYASRAVLLALPGATPDMVDTYLAQRKDALAAKLPPPPFPLGGGVATAVNVWRIRAEVTLPDGTVAVRVAVIRQGQDVRRMITVLDWQDGEGRALEVKSAS
jgi:general secretion pathway protein K